MAGAGAPAGVDEATIYIEAPPEAVYAVVSDITRMGELSPECTGGRWIRGATGPSAGARFVGFNRRGRVRWRTHNTVIVAVPGRELTFDTRESGARWSYLLEPEGDGTRVTERRSEFKARPLAARIAARLLLGGVEEHDQEMRDGLRATLERLKAVVEATQAR